MPGRAVLRHFVDDDVGGGASWEDLFEFLWRHYFPRLLWSKFTINPRKAVFFTNELHVLGFTRSKQGMRPSVDEVAAFRDMKSPTCEEELLRIRYALPYLKTFRADLTTIALSEKPPPSHGNHIMSKLVGPQSQALFRNIQALETPRSNTPCQRTLLKRASERASSRSPHSQRVLMQKRPNQNTAASSCSILRD
jgi:hypothetical protein